MLFMVLLNFVETKVISVLFYHVPATLFVLYYLPNPMFCRYNVAIKCATITPGTFDSYVDEICTLHIAEILSLCKFIYI